MAPAAVFRASATRFDSHRRIAIRHFFMLNNFSSTNNFAAIAQSSQRHLCINHHRKKGVTLLSSAIGRRFYVQVTEGRQVLKSHIPPQPLVDEPFGKTFLDAIWSHFIDSPNRIAVINAHNQEDKISFGQLFLNCYSVATFLSTQNFESGDVCAVVLPNCWQYMAIFGGILLRNGVMSGVNYNFTSHEMKRQFDDSKSKLVFCSEKNASTVLEAIKSNDRVTTVVVVPDTLGSDCGIDELKKKCSACQILHFDDILKIKPDNFVQPNVECDVEKDLILLPYSSGTTGHPKGVMISHFNFGMMMRIYSHHFDVAILPAIEESYDYRKERQLDMLPFYHIYGVGVIVNHLLNGSTCVILKSFEPNLFCEMLQQHRCKFLMLVPPIMIFLAKHPLVGNYDLSALKVTISGAAPVGKQLCEELIKRLPNIEHAVQGYGMTELSLCSHLPVLDGVHRFEKAGKVMPNGELKIVDVKTGKELGPNETGELYVRSPTVMLGYLDRPDATAETITEDGFLRTGDIAYVDEEGFLCVVDRLKELIKVSGYQVAPAELEDILLSNPKIHDCAVVGIADEKTGEAPQAFVVKKDETLTKEEVQEYVKDLVVYYKRVKNVEFLDSIPKSASGKILRRLLRDRANGK